MLADRQTDGHTYTLVSQYSAVCSFIVLAGRDNKTDRTLSNLSVMKLTSAAPDERRTPRATSDD